MANTYGIEVALKVIEKEIKDVFAVYGTHTSTLFQTTVVRLQARESTQISLFFSVSRYRGGPQTSVAGGRLHVFRRRV